MQQQAAVSPYFLGVAIMLAAAAAILVACAMQRRRLAAELAGLREVRARLDAELAVERLRSSRLPDLEQGLGQQRQLADELRAAKADADRECAAVSGALSHVEAALRDAHGRTAEAAGERDAARAECGRLGTHLATLQETLNKERLHAAEKLQLLLDAKETMTKEFRLLAADVMARHGESFSKQNKEQIDGLLGPMRDKLSEFQQGLHAAHTESAKERAALGEQIRGLSDASARMTTETTNLTRALKGKAQTQGAWGEMILTSILERSGLRDGAEFVSQASGVGGDGERLRPDVIVSLPNGQRIVIDAKVSLVAFEGHVNAATDGERDACLGRHLESMRTHIKTLSGKDYQTVADSRLSFVVMFVPIEGALAVALRGDPEITGFALENNVAIATPTTLMIALRTVHSAWQVECRNQNAEKIAEQAGKLYDKFVGFVADLEEIGQRLGQADACYRDALAKLTTGKGNLVGRIEKLKSMGARTGKALPGSLLGDDGEPAPPITAAVHGLAPAAAVQDAYGPVESVEAG